MTYQDVVRDFAQRTKKNLEVIEKLQDDHRGHTGEIDQEEVEVYEVTQLINSMLGLLVFPQQEYFEHIPEISLADLANQGWPKPLVTGTYPDVKTLRDLMRYMRNAISHFHIKFKADGQNRIEGLRIWNVNRAGEENWEATLSLYGLRAAVDRFLELVITAEQ
jgi:hypothetical protein